MQFLYFCMQKFFCSRNLYAISVFLYADFVRRNLYAEIFLHQKFVCRFYMQKFVLQILYCNKFVMQFLYCRFCIVAGLFSRFCTAAEIFLNVFLDAKCMQKFFFFFFFVFLQKAKIT